MPMVPQLAHGLRNLLRRRHTDEEITDEVDNFFAETRADFEARGFTREDATRATRLARTSLHWYFWRLPAVWRRYWDWWAYMRWFRMRSRNSGAPVANVTTAFVRSGLILSAVGCGCGFAAALALAPLMRSLLFSVSPSDPLTYAAMSASLIVTAALASYFPARKVTKIDPIETLRAE